MEGRSLDDCLFVTFRERQLLNLFWFGFILYTLSYTLSTSQSVNFIVCQSLQLVGIVIFITTACFIIKPRFENNYLKSLYILYLFWLFIIIVRGIAFDYNFLKFILFDAWYGGFIYFVPIFLLFPQKLFYYKRLLDVIVILGVFYILYDILFLEDLIRRGANLKSQGIVEQFSKTLSAPCLFMILVYKYQLKRKKMLIFFIVILTILFAIIRARRGLLLMFLIPFVFGYLLYISENGNKLFIILISLLTAGFLAFFIMGFLDVDKLGLFDQMEERGLEDTRSGVELCFYTDMGFSDWIIGKGMDGEYFCPGIDPDNVTGYRGVIETDYLQSILKGGLVSLGLFLVIAIPAIFMGLFYSKNLLSKAAGMWILWFLINMYPSSVHTFTLQHILVWVSIGICYSKTFRTIPEQILVDYFRGYKNPSGIEEDIQNQTH